MALFDPARQRLFQGGTFNGNAASMVAGAVTLDLLSRSEIERINSLGDRLRRGLRSAFADSGVRGQVVGIGSLLQVHFVDELVTNYRSAARTPKDLRSLLHLSLLNRGVFTSTRNSLCISTPMTEIEIDQAVEAFRKSFSDLRAVITE